MLHCIHCCSYSMFLQPCNGIRNRRLRCTYARVLPHPTRARPAKVGLGSPPAYVIFRGITQLSLVSWRRTATLSKRLISIIVNARGATHNKARSRLCPNHARGWFSNNNSVTGVMHCANGIWSSSWSLRPKSFYELVLGAGGVMSCRYPSKAV